MEMTRTSHRITSHSSRRITQRTTLSRLPSTRKHRLGFPIAGKRGPRTHELRLFRCRATASTHARDRGTVCAWASGFVRWASQRAHCVKLGRWGLGALGRAPRGGRLVHRKPAINLRAAAVRAPGCPARWGWRCRAAPPRDRRETTELSLPISRTPKIYRSETRKIM